ncbi:hypothetical protein SNE40_004504 [Patella caerulea]|uniref:Uncharacterized protein n=1 Tax=Patella caerulea TaxID=87958 RepID=A0AAN8K8X8_PATCE
MISNSDQYGLFLPSSDSEADVETLFSGHLPGRRLRGIKLNPIFHERGYEDLHLRSQSESDLTADDINLRVYESLPRSKLFHSKPLERKFSSDSSLLDSDKHDSDACSRRIGIANRFGSHRKHRARHKYDIKRVKSSVGSRTTNDDDTGYGECAYDYNTFSSDMTEKSYKHEPKRVKRKSSRRAAIMDMTSFDSSGDSIKLDSASVKEHNDDNSSETDSHFDDLTPTQDDLSTTFSDWNECMEPMSLPPSLESRTRMSIQRKGFVGRVNSSRYKKTAVSSSSNDESMEYKPIKPILLSSSSCEESTANYRRKSCVSSGESKMVTFAEDTVFNEDKPKRYQKERINLKDLYGGRIFSSSAIAKINPLFTDDDGLTVVDEDNNGLTDDEKAERHTYPGSISQSSISSGSTLSAQNLDLNTPSYLSKYLSHVSRDTRHTATSGETSTGSPDIYIPLDIDVDSNKEEGRDSYLSTEALYGVPQGYDRLLLRRMAKRKRLQIIKLIVIVVALFVIVAGGISLVIYFSSDKS